MVTREFSSLNKSFQTYTISIFSKQEEKFDLIVLLTPFSLISSGEVDEKTAVLYQRLTMFVVRKGYCNENIAPLDNYLILKNFASSSTVRSERLCPQPLTTNLNW